MSTTNAARRRAQQLRRAKARRGGRAGEEQIPLRLLICGLIFVLLVAVKLLFPDTLGRMTDSAQQLLGRDADFEEAFAAVGRAVSGERPVGDSLQEAYAAVFNPVPQPEIPEEEPETETEPDPQPENVTAPAAAPDAALLRYNTLTLPEADKEIMREMVITMDGADPMSLPAGDGTETAPPETGDEPEAEPEEAVAAMSQVYTMAPPPENASLELRNLGFDHCTPVAGKLSSTFGWREHPIAGGNRFHYGVDLAAEEGTDILAFADGEVYASGESSTLGNYIMLCHEEGYITLYAHCSRVTATGGSVSMGEKIAEVGSTGLATGPHLHFELHDGELYLNPIYYVAVG